MKIIHWLNSLYIESIDKMAENVEFTVLNAKNANQQIGNMGNSFAQMYPHFLFALNVFLLRQHQCVLALRDRRNSRSACF